MQFFNISLLVRMLLVASLLVGHHAEASGLPMGEIENTVRGLRLDMNEVKWELRELKENVSRLTQANQAGVRADGGSSSSGELVLMVLGGSMDKSETHLSSDVIYFDFSRQSWSSLAAVAPLTSPREGGSAVTVGKEDKREVLYLGGHLQTGGGDKSGVEAFSPRDLQWHPKAEMLSKHSWGSALQSSDGQYLYTISGDSGRTFLNRLDLSAAASSPGNSSAWMALKELNTNKRESGAVLVNDQWIYIFGGLDGDTEIWRFNIVANEWVRVANDDARRRGMSVIHIPRPRQNMPGSGLNTECVYLLGGYLDNKMSAAVTRWCFNPEAEIFDTRLTSILFRPVISTVTPMSFPRAYSAAVLHGNQIYVIGGQDEYGNSLDSVDTLDLATMTWSLERFPPMPVRLASPAAVMFEL